MFDLPPSKAQEGITTLPLPFVDDILSHVSYSDEEEQYQHDLDIDVVPHEYLDPYLAYIPNQMPKPRWAQKLIEAVVDGVGNLEERRRTRFQYQNEHVSLSLTHSLPIEWCNKIPRKCYMIIANDQPLVP